MELIKKMIIKKERVPVVKCGCSYCEKHEALYAVGKHGEQTNLCGECLSKEGNLIR